MTNIGLTDTTASAISAHLTQIRHRMGAPAVGMVLTLVVLCDEADHYDAVQAATGAAREHPSRILVVIPRRRGEETRLDAEIRTGESAPGEVVLLRLYGELVNHADSVVAPLLLPDTPVVAWWPGEAPAVPGADAVGALAQRRITDAAACPDPRAAIASRAPGYTPGDTDLAWTRLTRWRSLLAAAFDLPTAPVVAGVVEAEADNPSAPLLAGWLTERLAVPVETAVSTGPGISAVRLTLADGEVRISRRPHTRLAQLTRPDQPERTVALARRPTADLLAEELRRLDPDEIYAVAVARLPRPDRDPA
ncbi:glucose-6-phosphate dehydrogenase assembly protein OpcA [Rhizohabitans arisaemae]|uniref:glucose-6-phosphate dehydrogenase assembly protein OpcA n=1 Tax=Rhizohabitans arisaemae TaxID=2720610 RepID=UPI0024B03E36|nr:glucose-6-phosphate dehydrogenase assembly protein OpcA [Rhizohabitans arisaemae]